jgi:hypothetical protein
VVLYVIVMVLMHSVDECHGGLVVGGVEGGIMEDCNGVDALRWRFGLQLATMVLWLQLATVVVVVTVAAALWLAAGDCGGGDCGHGALACS